MTLQWPKESMGDRVLKRLGRRRVVRCAMRYSRVGTHAYLGARKESFFVALFASNKRQLKSNCFFLDDVLKEINSEKQQLLNV